MFMKFQDVESDFRIIPKIKVNFLNESISEDTFYVNMEAFKVPKGKNNWFEMYSKTTMDLKSRFNVTED